MNTSGEAADLMVKEGIQITESAAKLAGLGAKNLAAILIALMKDEGKLQGKTKIRQLIKSEKPLCILTVKEADLKRFNAEAKKYGVLFSIIKEKGSDTGLCDIIAKQDDVATLNYIMEKLGYTAPVTREENSKKSPPRAKTGKENRQEKESSGYGDTEKEGKDTKPSVRSRIELIKAQQKQKSDQKTKTKGKSR